MSNRMKKKIAGTKLWSLGKEKSGRIERFTVNRDRELDIQLAEFDTLGTMAHAMMLHSVKLLTARKLTRLKNELNRLYQLAKQGRIKIEPAMKG